ncbi:GH23598 [Drosophila grimshawi]|uniref:GH23598 n=1 Tax=Drosophila grimshawi TaxID=7222 RepID=B4K2K5_DROGR|nr:GH23598 [Drosophila grimshawi]
MADEAVDEEEDFCCCCDSTSLTTTTTTTTSAPQFSIFQWIGLETAEQLPPHIIRYYNNLHQQVNDYSSSRRRHCRI